MKKPEPIIITDLFFKIEEELIKLLKSLNPGDWHTPTLAPQWTVKDIVTHLLDTQMRSIAIFRDNFFGENPGEINSYQDMVAFLNRLNAEWVKATKRLSPSLLIDLLQSTREAFIKTLLDLDPQAAALFSVAWAGEEESKNWFHVAREYTERWHHQQQIRVATSQDAILLQAEFYEPYLDTSIRVLPHHYREVEAAINSIIQFSIAEKYHWFLKKNSEKWELFTEVDDSIHTQIHIPAEIAWRIFSKEISQEEVQANIQIEGNTKLGEQVWNMVAVMA